MTWSMAFPNRIGTYSWRITETAASMILRISRKRYLPMKRSNFKKSFAAFVFSRIFYCWSAHTVILLHYITCRYRGISGSFFRKLREVDFPVSITGTQQFSMSTLTCQSTVIKDKDQVCLLNAGGTLGYQKCSYFPVKSVERLTQCCISGKVQGTGTVIQDQDSGFLPGTGNGKSLFLAAGKVLPFCST